MEVIATPRKRKTFSEESSIIDNSNLITPKRIRWKLSKESPVSSPSQKALSLAVHQQLGDLLQGLEKDQLVNILTTLAQSHSAVETAIIDLLPRPTVENTSRILLNLEKKLFESMPYSKLGPDRSDYAFNRVRPALNELIGSLTQYLDFFTLPASYPPSLQHEYTNDAFGYLHFATSLIHRLPIWNNDSRNVETREPIYEKLGLHWRIVVSEVGRRVNQEGKVFGSLLVGEWLRNLSLHSSEVKDRFGFKEAYDELTRSVGWVVGMGDQENAMRNAYLPFGMMSGSSNGFSAY